jgi:hypothetical protein
MQYQGARARVISCVAEGAVGRDRQRAGGKMPLRILGWSLIFSMLAGNAIAAQVDDNVSLSQLRAENKAVIFFYTGTAR